MLFSRRDLTRLIVPLILEQTLAITIGMADTVMVTSVGEAAVSGISLVDSITILLIGVFGALATGGAVVTAQYLGREDRVQAKLSANQLLLATTGLSLVLMAVCLIGGRWMLGAIYGQVETAVMDNAATYFFWTALSFPFLALYNGGAALFRVMGNSKVSLVCSVLMNIVNIGGNALLIFGFGMGVAGAAIASLVSRALAALVVTWLLRKPECPLLLDKTIFQPHGRMISRILSIGIPNGLENSMFQIGKILIQGLVATMGTVAMAANAVGNSIAGFPNIAGNAVGLALITVVGQCVGAGETQQARHYTHMLHRVSWLLMVGLNVVLLVGVKPLVNAFHLSAETSTLTIQILVTYAIASIACWSPSFLLPNGLRAAGDAKFTMWVSAFSMWVFRIGGCFVYCNLLGFGVIGTWLAMYTDWAFRAVVFLLRSRGDKWLQKKVI